MGKERKVEIDDKVPVVYGNSLFPRSINKTEIWPSIITKALLKLHSGRWSDPKAREVEIGDGSIIYALTGYIPETIDLQANSNFYGIFLENIVLLFSQMEKHQRRP